MRGRVAGLLGPLLAGALLALLVGAGRAGAADPRGRLEQVLRASKDYKQRLAAAIGLARLNDRGAVPALIEALRDLHHTVRGAAASALGKLGDERAKPALEALLKREQEDYVIGQAQTALATLLRGTGAPKGSPSEMQVDGTLGTLDREAVQGGVRARVPLATACFSRELENAPYLDGQVLLKFRVATDGKVKWVRFARSDLGSLVVEQCVLGEMAQATFEAPDGGEAEFTIPLRFKGERERAQPEGEAPAAAGALRKSCKQILKPKRPQVALSVPPGLQVTAYVDSDGTILAAGLSAAGNEIPSETALELVARLKALSLGPQESANIVKVTVPFNCR